MPDSSSKIVDGADIRMYRLGTGDCFTIKFKSGRSTTHTMLIDCGYWSGTYAEKREVIRTMAADVDNTLDTLVVTHEHKDHVDGFAAAESMFARDFSIGNVWMGWSENDSDPTVRAWKDSYGEKKRALALAADEVNKHVSSESFRARYGSGLAMDREVLAMRDRFAEGLAEFAGLHADGLGVNYKGGLKGMQVVKERLVDGNLQCLETGDVWENIEGLDGVRVYVLGPPTHYRDVKREHGEGGESYKHNKELESADLLLRAFSEMAPGFSGRRTTPFDATLADDLDRWDPCELEVLGLYEDQDHDWRRIDDDWLFSAGQFALRMNSLTNNLSLVLAFEFIESGKVMLFPGDAEFGSWASWHDLVWEIDGQEVTASDLLGRTVFYKVAHHLSHNGTARSLGLDLMTDRDLVAMATLDYGSISSGWKRTMPNLMILRDLLEKTHGRLMVMNYDGLHCDPNRQTPLKERIREVQHAKMSTSQRAAYNRRVDVKDHFIEYKLRGV